MNAFRHRCVLVALAAIVLSGCGVPQGRPTKGAEVLAPKEILDFGTLYAQNCAGCHGAEGRGGAATTQPSTKSLPMVCAEPRCRPLP